ncbi:MAG: energy transducer TonB [Bacteroidaceae bacterium]|nr:energy transducer TonB [Bacteroidaceae bacterium]
MGAFVVYILEWSTCLLGFQLLYKMCFSGTTFHRFNRFYLLGGVVLSAFLPLIHIIPSEQMEPMADACRTVVWIDEGTLDSISINSAMNINTGSLTTMEKGVVFLLAIYILYILIQLIGWAKSTFKMLRFLHGKQCHKVGKWVWLVEHDADYGPFSWMNCIVISRHEQGFGRRASMRHELSHIVLLHHIDLLFLMACVIVNPICWMVMKEIKIVHEYEADDEVINHYRIQSRDYQRLLIMRTVGAEAYALASSFNLNIKKRIIMMKKKQSHWWCIIWIAITIPLIGFSLMAFSKPKEALKEAVDHSVKMIEQPLTEVVKSELFRTESTTTEESPKTEKEDEIEPLSSDVKPGDIITGTVSDQNEQPLKLANLIEEDELHRVVMHAVTDMNGKFSFKVVNPKHKIRVSYVGFKTKTLDISSNQIDVVLEPATLINEVKVIGVSDSIDLSNPRYQEKAYLNEPDVFHLVEEAPTFPGGQEAIYRYLSMHLKYPSVAREMHVEGDIVVRFTVDKTGLVRSPQVVNVTSKTPLVTDETIQAAKDGDKDAEEVATHYYDAVEAMKEEAIHVVRNMPRWEPGRQNGQRIETTYTLPISFKLQ